MDEKMLSAICAVRQKHDQAALITIIVARGSTPRKAGSKMLVYSDGRILGTIGGGCAEAEAKLFALRALDENRCSVYRISLTHDTAADEGMACGGMMEVFIQII